MPVGGLSGRNKISDSGVLPYVYFNGTDSLKKAHDRFGGSQGLLRSAAQVLGGSPPAAYQGNDSKAAGYDEIRELTCFARDAGLMMDTEKVRTYMAEHAMRGGSEHKVADVAPIERA